MGTIGTPVTGSPILATDIEAFINSCMEDTIIAADLTEAIKLCLRDLSNMGLLLGIDSSQDLDSGDLTLDCPPEYKDVEAITLTDVSGKAYEPLTALSGGHKEYRQLMEDSPSTGTPESFSEFNGHFYLWPPPDAHYHILIEYSKYDTQDPTAIEFGGEFSNALKFGTVYFYAMIRGRERYIALWQQKYENEKEFRRLNMKKQPYITE